MTNLVAYYSRSNTIRKVAEEIAKRLNADIEEIKPKVNYKGKIGFARGGKDAISAKIVDLEDLKYDPSNYDMVYLGVPLWAGKAANPMISYIKQNEGKFNNVKFFVSSGGGSGYEGVFKQLEEYVKKSPQKTLSLTGRDVKSDKYLENLDSFLE